MLRPLVLLLTVLSLGRAGATKEKRNGDDVVFYCCTPARWTARVRAETTNLIEGVMNEKWMTFHYDKANQRVAYTHVTENNQPAAFQRTIEDYKNHAWTIVVDKDLCVTYNLTGSFSPKCTPHDISFVSFAVAPVLGPIQGVFANTAYFSRPHVTGHMTVTVGDCALVEEVTYDLSMKDHPTVDNLQYFNQTLDVDQTVFDIPDNCIYVPPASPKYGRSRPTNQSECHGTQ